MTDDFKNKLLKYLTGNLPLENGSNVPQFSTSSSKVNNLQTYLNTQFQYGYFMTGLLQGANASGDTTGFTLMYGFYDTTDGFGSFKGFVLMLDADFDVVQLITTFSTGTTLNIIEILQVGDDGNFFGIDTDGATRRFIMLNNFTVKLPTEASYKIVLRQSYNLTANIKDAVSYSNILKSPSQSYYLIVGSIYDGSFNPQPIATQLKVNVGTANEWTEYRYASTVLTYPTDAFASWDTEGNLTFKISSFDDLGSNNLAYTEYSKSGSALARQQFGAGLGTPSSLNAKLVNLTTAYIVYTVLGLTEVSYIYKADYSTNTLKSIYSKSYPGVDMENISGIGIFKNGSDMYYTLLTNVDSIPSFFDYFFGKIVDETIYENYFGQFTWETVPGLFYVQKQFNLYIYYIQTGDTVNYVYQIYNPLNYNGLEYSNENSLIPNNAILRDENNVAIFARNLYNISINNNTTTATIEIPNDYLNDKLIYNQCLFSETNTELLCSYDSIQKNIYESVLLNFVSTIMMKNSNNPSAEVQNPAGAVKVNGAINVDDNYANTKALKLNVIYSDLSSYIITIDPSQISYALNVATYGVMIYVPTGKTVTKTQLLSNDETTIYNEMTMSLAQNKYYLISQKVEVI